jgi:flagellin
MTGLAAGMPSATIPTQGNSWNSPITQLATDRATIGANVARLQYTDNQLAVLRDNLSAATSRIKDVDIAEESTRFARYSILVQAGTAMLAQANASPQAALRLLS